MSTAPAFLERKTRLGLTPAAWLLLAIAVLAAGLRLLNLGALGYANHYYTAAVQSMLQSWHNFFYLAAEPGGAVSVDKPPLGLWLQAASAAIFGVNGFAVLLPQIAAGVLSVIVLYILVKRWFGPAAGLLAALALAVSPVAVAVDRNNTIDSTLVLALLLAAWAFIKAAESGGLRFVLLGALLVGLGFNIKMLQAMLPLPAFYAVYFFGSPERLWRKLFNLLLASGLLLAVALSWALLVDLTPASQRPYVGSSTDNTVMELIFGHNGIRRLFGRDGLPGSSIAAPGSGAAQPGAVQPVPNPPAGNTMQPPQTGQNRPPQFQGPQPAGSPQGPGAPPNQGAPGPAQPGRQQGGFGGAGMPGMLRLFSAPLDNETAWLLPFAVLSIVLLLFSARPAWPVARPHQALALWGGWAVVSGIVLSSAEFFHEYYLVMLAPPLAALLGIGLAQAWQTGKQHPRLAGPFIVVAAGSTLGMQFLIASRYLASLNWLMIPVAIFGLGAVLALAASLPELRRWSAWGYGLVVTALLITPLAWSVLTALHPSANQSLPAAYTGGDDPGPANRGGLQVNTRLLELLQADTQDVEYLLAVPSSMQGSDYVLATGRPVLYIGGFLGSDRVIDAAGLARMVASGELRYIYWDVDNRGNNDISRWVRQSCRLAPGFETSTRNAGAPDGTGAVFAGAGAPPGAMGVLRINLYRCGN